MISIVSGWICVIAVSIRPFMFFQTLTYLLIRLSPTILFRLSPVVNSTFQHLHLEIAQLRPRSPQIWHEGDISVFVLSSVF